MTTIVSIRDEDSVVIVGDGQVSLGNTVMKSTACKIKRLYNDKVIVGFAGSTADAMALQERLDAKLEKHSGQLMRAAVEMAKDWRTDKYLRRLEAMMVVVDKETSLVVSGTGDVLEPENGIVAIGSGGNYALSAAKGMIAVKNKFKLDINRSKKIPYNNGLSLSSLDNKGVKCLDAKTIALASLEIASDICVFTNNNFVIEEIKIG